MRYPWQVTTSSNEQKHCTSKKSAVAFAQQWVEGHPSQSATIYRRCDMQPAIRIEWDADSHRTCVIPIRTRARRSSHLPKGFAEAADAKLRELGFSSRRAREVRHAVFAILKHALRDQREPVAWTPIGVLFASADLSSLVRWARTGRPPKKRIQFKFRNSVLEALQ
jgi:hypothetical protein